MSKNFYIKSPDAYVFNIDDQVTVINSSNSHYNQLHSYMLSINMKDIDYNHIKDICDIPQLITSIDRRIFIYDNMIVFKLQITDNIYSDVTLTVDLDIVADIINKILNKLPAKNLINLLDRLVVFNKLLEIPEVYKYINEHKLMVGTDGKILVKNLSNAIFKEHKFLSNYSMVCREFSGKENSVEDETINIKKSFIPKAAKKEEPSATEIKETVEQNRNESRTKPAEDTKSQNFDNKYPTYNTVAEAQKHPEKIIGKTILSVNGVLYWFQRDSGGKKRLKRKI